MRSLPSSLYTITGSYSYDTARKDFLRFLLYDIYHTVREKHLCVLTMQPPKFALVALLLLSPIASTAFHGPSFVGHSLRQPQAAWCLAALPGGETTTTASSSSTAAEELNTVGMTERIMKRTLAESQATGAGGASTYDAFLRAEANWSRLKQSDALDSHIPTQQQPAPFVTDDAAIGRAACWDKLRAARDDKSLDYDIVVCGGTLGIFFATALQLRAYRVCVLEAGPLRGREQEWNISMDELLELVELGVLTLEDVDAAVQTEFPGCRSGFKNKEITPLAGGYFENDEMGYECTTDGVLNLGVSPAILLERVAARFQQLGGVIRDRTRLESVAVSETVGAALDLGEDEEPITAQLVIDCMGNASPISRQQRYGLKPDGVCAVVGSCAAGFDAKTNLQGDIIYTMDPIQDKGDNGKLQYFWESFPVGIGRNGKEPGTSDTMTTYMVCRGASSDLIQRETAFASTLQ